MKFFEIFKKKPQETKAKTGNFVVDFYTSHCDEESRLLSRHGRIEFLTTIKYVEKYLKENMKIFEIGAGTGRYSHYFARKGFDVDAVELVEHNIEVFKSKTEPNENITIRQGNALDLSDYADNSYDVTLLFGPMYHLYTLDDQKKALSEAIRVTKPDGIIFVAYCMVDASLISEFRKGRIQKLIEQGLLDGETMETHFPPEGIFKLYTVDEIKNLSADFNAERLALIAADGFANHMTEELQSMSDKEYELYTKYHFSTCEREELLGYSNHTLDILRKKQ